MFSNDLAIDLGTANTLIYSKGRGIVCNEPSVVAVTKLSGGRRKVLAVGTEAKDMLGRTPENIEAIRPMKDGVIADFEVTEEMLRMFIKKVQNKKSFIKPRIIICVPYGVTEVEKRAVKESAESAGAREVYLIEEPMAAAIGAGMPVTEPMASMIVDIGGGTTELAIISLKGIVYSKSIRVGGDTFDDAITQYLKRNYNLLIGESTAEKIKISIGSALNKGEQLSAEVRGRDMVQGGPKAIIINQEDILFAFEEPLNRIIEIIKNSLEKVPPELASDIFDKGIYITGGGALLRNFAELISINTGLEIKLVEDPLVSVVKGSGQVLDRLEELKDVIIN